ncbi:MAG: HNH endonuclease [candidate division Zixibacteria bacterium]|nr:HNH endonuclease [candidate division Zixibacteria bacterium]
MARHDWTRDQLLVAFNLYCRTPFGRMHSRNPEIIQLAHHISRTPSAVAMKLTNFASLDPALQARDIRGLDNISQSDRAIWTEFNGNWTKLAYESQKSMSAIFTGVEVPSAIEPEIPSGPTEAERSVQVRLVQSFFRQTVLASYDQKCSMCQFGLRRMLVASHIIPWHVDAKRRADPRNGIALCVFHDRAFDFGYISVDESSRVILGRSARSPDPPKMHRVALLQIEGKTITAPRRFAPDPASLRYHREHIFNREN